MQIIAFVYIPVPFSFNPSCTTCIFVHWYFSLVCAYRHVKFKRRAIPFDGDWCLGRLIKRMCKVICSMCIRCLRCRAKTYVLDIEARPRNLEACLTLCGKREREHKETLANLTTRGKRDMTTMTRRQWSGRGVQCCYKTKG
jgi:hypothetical protein